MIARNERKLGRDGGNLCMREKRNTGKIMSV